TATAGTARPPTAKAPTPKVSAAAWLANAPLRPSHPPPPSYRLEMRRRSVVDIFLYLAASIATLVAVTVGVLTLQGPVAEEPSTPQPALTRTDAEAPSPAIAAQNSPQATPDIPAPPVPQSLEARDNTAPATGRSRIAGLAPLPQPTTGPRVVRDTPARTQRETNLTTSRPQLPVPASQARSVRPPAT